MAPDHRAVLATVSFYNHVMIDLAETNAPKWSPEYWHQGGDDGKYSKEERKKVKGQRAVEYTYLVYTTFALCLSVLAATAADRYGEWLLEQPRSSVLALSFKQSVPLNNKIATSELGLICDQRDKL
jgi:hypothetical protein